MRVSFRTIGFTVLSAALLATPASPSGQAAAEVFTATAAVKTAGGASASAPVTITIDRKMSQREAETVTAAFKTGGAAALRKALVGVAPTGSMQIGAGAATPTRFTIERPTGPGRLADDPHRSAAGVCRRAACRAPRPKKATTSPSSTSRSMPKVAARGRSHPPRRSDESGRVRRRGLRRRGRPADGGQEDEIGRRAVFVAGCRPLTGAIHQQPRQIHHFVGPPRHAVIHPPRGHPAARR